MYPILGLNAEWWLIIIIGVVGLIVQGRLQAVFSKYSKVMFPGGMTGKDVAEKMLRDNGITDVTVTATSGSLTDNFNPRNKTVNLSESVYGSNSLAAAAVAAHECGHAIQHARGYKPLELRSALVPVISFSSRFATWVIILGVVIMASTNNDIVFWIGIILVALSALFSIITLPVEYNASHRAMQWLKSTRMLNDSQLSEAGITLRWAARTYLVAALSAIAVLLYYLSFARRN